MIRKGIGKEMLEKMERQNNNTLKLANIETTKEVRYRKRYKKRKRHNKKRERK